MQAPAAYLTRNEDDGHIVADLLHLLENVNGDDLASFLESEHRELLRLRDQVRVYKAGISELANHLQHVFCAVGGLSSLPLSPNTRGLLAQPTSPGLVAPMTPLSPSNKARSRYVIPLVRSPSNTAFKLQQAPPRPRPPPSQSTQDVAVQTDGDRFGGLAAELQHTVDEQRADIVDLEMSLRERRTEVRVLRKQLRDQELRQFAVASDCVGLRRTASIMIESGSSGFLAQMRAAGNWPPAETMPAPEDFAQRAGAEGRLARVSSESSLVSGTSPPMRPSTTSSRSGNRESGATGALGKKHRPSAYINGWPVYDNGVSHNASPVEHTDIVRPPRLASSSDDISIGPTKAISGLSTPRTSRLPSTELAAATPKTRASSSMHQVPPPRTPSLFVSAVAKAPRRIYSRLSNRLKKV
ncbi:hypothetical protein IWW37_004154 [Coemansia sp. RSA 2050]|nr:hypothetical protein IWW37_004154 [Coemansia sp. RSA 2050]KAJ2731919.1 hypothetical protein IW152_004209 [Coemansia sp. BCRC 34962]